MAARPVAAFPLRRDGAQAPAEDIEALEKLADESTHKSSIGGAPFTFTAPMVRPAGGFELRPPRSEPATARLAFTTAATAEPASLPATAAPEPCGPGGRSSPPGTEQQPVLPEESATDLRRRTGSAEFPSELCVLGQVESSYIVATNAEGLWIVDQHAAHERILFERHLRQVGRQEVEAQRLLLPIIVELKPPQQVAFGEIADELVANGFEVEPFGHRTVAVKAAPAEVRPEDVKRLLIEILDEAGREARSLSLEILRARITASVACHAAIKVHMALDRSKMDWLLAELGRAESPMSCPHGRPVILRYSIQDLERAFRRI